MFCQEQDILRRKSDDVVRPLAKTHTEAALPAGISLYTTRPFLTGVMVQAMVCWWMLVG